MGIPAHEYEHYEKMLRRMSRVKRYFDEAARQITAKINGAVYIDRNKALLKAINDILENLNIQLQNNIIEGSSIGWDIANEGNNQIANFYLEGSGLSVAAQANFYQPNIGALKAFLTRVEGGMGISDRVWKSTKVANELMELYLGAGIPQGKSAASLSRDVRELLLEPDKLFRRVRDENGKLVLSKAAKAYHPGQGVYRSSYQNALRLTQTEINMAFRSSDFARRQQLPFVTGFTVHLSSAHPRYDICDDLQGDYPKGFLFRGWHPRCICYTTSKMLSKADFNTYLQSGQLPINQFERQLPSGAWRWIEDNKDRVQKWENRPYFLNDNFTKDFKLKKKVLKVPGVSFFSDEELTKMLLIQGAR